MVASIDHPHAVGYIPHLLCQSQVLLGLEKVSEAVQPLLRRLRQHDVRALCLAMPDQRKKKVER